MGPWTGLDMSRRSWLGTTLGVPALGVLGTGGSTRENLPTPNLADPSILRFTAGIRPTRRGGIRIEREALGSKVIVHNYGHGGGGITMSWGSAEVAVALVEHARPAPSRVAVLGAGAVGLATARVLQEHGYSVALYAQDFPPHTTSNIAGGIWHPASLVHEVGPDQREQFRAMMQRSWDRFAALDADLYGIRKMPYYEFYGDRESERNPDLPFSSKPIARLPFAGGDRPGFVAETFLIEPPIYMAEMLRQVLVAGGVPRQMKFDTPDQIAALSEPVVVHCTGYGAKAIFDDQALVPTRGQLVHLFPEALEYLLVGIHGYLIPRGDALLLGGTYETGVGVAEPVDADCREILAQHRRFYGV